VPISKKQPQYRWKARNVEHNGTDDEEEDDIQSPFGSASPGRSSFELMRRKGSFSSTPPTSNSYIEHANMSPTTHTNNSAGTPNTTEGYQPGGWFELDMSGMALKSLSPTIKHFTHITALYINNNNLTTLPDELFIELRALSTLDISSNHLTSLSNNIGRMDNLKKLLIHQNKLSELPVELGRLYKLKELQVDSNPLTVPPLSVIQQGTAAIISYCRDRMPSGPPPPERKFISYIDQSVVLPEREKFRVSSYNVLAEGYATGDRYFYCPSWALDWNYRKQGILKELLSYDCDVICLQEVEAGQYTQYFQPEMSKHGFTGVYAPKSRARTMEDWSSVDGCAIFFKRNKFVLVEEHLIEFQSIAMSRHKELSVDPEAFSRIITKDNIALAVILQLKDEISLGNSASGSSSAPGSPAKQPFRSGNNTGNSKPRHVLISNTHIHWNPDHKDVKLVQVQLLLEQLTAITSPKTKWYKIPMVVCGDFNSAVDSGPYELLSTGVTSDGTHSKYSDLHPYNYGSYSIHGMRHPVPLSSAYGAIGEPAFTNYTGDFNGVLDYLWFTHDTLSVSKVLQPVDEETVKQTRLPNAFMNSDHISLMSEFFFKRKN